jgi:GTPase
LRFPAAPCPPIFPLFPARRTGEFIPCTVRSIHIQYTPVDVAYPGGSAAFAIRPKSKVHVEKRGKTGGSFARKGMVLADPGLMPNAFWEFNAEILVLHHQTTLSMGYAPIIHVGTVVQSAKITGIRSVADGAEIPALRTGDRAIITGRFMYRPEYLHIGDMLLFREGRCKGVGKVVGLASPHHVGGVAVE